MHASKALQDISVIEDIWMTGLLDTVIRAFELGRLQSEHSVLVQGAPSCSVARLAWLGLEVVKGRAQCCITTVCVSL